MYYMRDLYPNMDGLKTQEKTLSNPEDVRALHQGAGNGLSIWMALGLMLAVVVILGIFGSK